MRKTCISIIFVCALFIINNHAVSLEVDIDEIKTKPVRFINYEGKYDRPDSEADIGKIGQALSRDAKENERVRFYIKYSVIHAVSKEEPEKFSADIFSIDKDAKVGHIAMVRKITSAYLMSKYGYSSRNAETISLFLSYYNAIYRGNMGYFSGKYKTAVMKHVTANNAGISTKYTDWAGSTKMLIPLTEAAQKGKLDAIAPEIISDKKVRKEVSRDEKNIPARKDMAGIKERVLEKEKKELEEKKQEVKKEAGKIEQEKKPVEEKKTEIVKKEEQLKKEKEEAKKIAEPEKRKEKESEIEKKEKQIEKEKAEAKKKEEEIAKKEIEAKKEEKKIAEKETKITEREKELQKEKKEIERDELKRDIAKEPEKVQAKLEEKAKELDKREDAIRSKEPDKNIYANKLYYLKIKEYLDGGHYNNEMNMIDASTMKVMFKSPVEFICGSRYDVFSGGVVVITHRGSHTMGHRLTLMDRETLKATANGDDNIFWRSFIEIRDGFIYVIVNDKGKYHLGRFDGNLKLVAKSKEDISEDTFISFFEDKIYINRLDKTIVALKKDDLSLIGEVKP
ncbi:MAG: P83/100 family protein [Spirochaetota bacterium]